MFDVSKFDCYHTFVNNMIGFARHIVCLLCLMFIISHKEEYILSGWMESFLLRRQITVVH